MRSTTVTVLIAAISRTGLTRGRLAPMASVHRWAAGSPTVTLGRLLAAYCHSDASVSVDASANPYKFHHYGVNLIGFDHGHSIRETVRLAALMANECRDVWGQTVYREWHRIKSYNWQKRGGMAFVWDHDAGPICRLQVNVSSYTGQIMGRKS